MIFREFIIFRGFALYFEMMKWAVIGAAGATWRFRTKGLSGLGHEYIYLSITQYRQYSHQELAIIKVFFAIIHGSGRKTAPTLSRGNDLDTETTNIHQPV